MRWRVVCALGVMMEIFSPMSALSNVLLPAFGFPMMVTKPDLNDMMKKICLADHADLADKNSVNDLRETKNPSAKLPKDSLVAEVGLEPTTFGL